MSDNLSKVAILLVVTNEAHHLTLFCQSILKQDHENIRLFVLDNNCTDNSAEIIRSICPAAWILSVNENMGFAKGNNILAEEAIKLDFDLLFILNPDIELHTNCVSNLVKLINSDDSFSAVAPIMFFGRQQRDLFKIQCYGDNFDYKKRIYKSLYGEKIFKENELPKEIQVNLISGGITFIKSNVVKEIGLFDERYYIYGEEADLAFRSFLAGYKMKVTSEARVWHHHDYSPKNKEKHYFSYFYMNRSKILYFTKYKLYKPLTIELFKELIFFPVKVKWSLKTADIKLLKFYYLGLWRGLIGETGKTRTEFK